MGDALFQTPYALATPCRLPERRLLPTFALIIICFSILNSLSRELFPDHLRCQGLRAFFISPPLSPIMGDALSQTPYTQASPCRLPERRLLPTLHKYFLFFNFKFSLAKVVSRSPAVPGPPRIFYFSPSVPHYGGCALPDALCACHSLPSSRASAPADFCTNYYLFFNFKFSLAGVVSRSPAVPGPPRVFYFSPSVPHYGGCVLTDALCAGPSLPSSRASAPADIGSFL